MAQQSFSPIFEHKENGMKKLLLAAAVLVNVTLRAQVLSLRGQAAVVNQLLAERLNNLLPVLMEKTGIDYVGGYLARIQ